MLCRSYIDITANWVDPMGKYGMCSSMHTPSFNNVLIAAWEADLDKIIITGTSLPNSRQALELSKKHNQLFCSVGVHPESVAEFEAKGKPDGYLSDLEALVKDNRDKVVALGCGLDYSRAEPGRDRQIQAKYFEQQVLLAIKLRLPLILHCRAAYDDLWTVLNKHSPTFGGVVSSFDQPIRIAEKFINLGLKIGISGVSMKNEGYLHVARLPVENILVGTDFPRGEFSGMSLLGCAQPKTDTRTGTVNDPKTIELILELIASLKGVSEDRFCYQVFHSTMKTFFPTLKY